MPDSQHCQPLRSKKHEQLHDIFARRDDLEFVAKMVDKGAIDRLQHVASTPFKRLTYTEAIEILEGVVRDGKKKFEFPVSGAEP